MSNKPRGWALRLVTLAAVIVAYFFCYPEDLALLQQCLAITQAVPFGLYLLASVLIVCKTGAHLWATRPHKPDERFEPGRPAN
jgi:hypothetical protein